MNAKQTVEGLLDLANISINGSNPWDVQVYDERLYKRLLAGGSLALGESYMDGWWNVEDLPEFFNKVLQANLSYKLVTPGFIFYMTTAKLFNLQSKSRAFKVGEEHYDIGNNLYKDMLDSRMVYTCGYWSGASPAKSLDEAQEHKLDLVCRKIGLKKGDKVLDIGGGWGSFAKFAYEKYGAETVAITISKEQAEFGKNLTKGLPIEIRVQDYRDLDSEEKFDHVVSLGMFEHVGHKNYKNYMKVVSKVLKDDGLFLLHTIGRNKSVYGTDPWIHKYIFPNGMLPSTAQIGKAIGGRFVMEDWHNFGVDYEKTISRWFYNFDHAWPNLKNHYNDRFYRMWKYYLNASEGAFRARKNQLWQIVLSKNGVRDGYKSVR